MRVFEIRTTKSDYPFLVVAEGFKQAVDILQREKQVYDGDITNVQQLDAYKGSHILLEPELTAHDIVEQEVRRELAEKMPHWQRMPNGAAGGGDRECFLIRSSAGHYFTSACIGGDGYYLNMDDLEQLPGITENEVLP